MVSFIAFLEKTGFEAALRKSRSAALLSGMGKKLLNVISLLYRFSSTLQLFALSFHRIPVHKKPAFQAGE